MKPQESDPEPEVLFWFLLDKLLDIRQSATLTSCITSERQVCCEDKLPHLATCIKGIWFAFETLDDKDKGPNFSSWDPCQLLFVWLALKACICYANVTGWSKTQMSCLTLAVKKINEQDYGLNDGQKRLSTCNLNNIICLNMYWISDISD